MVVQGAPGSGKTTAGAAPDRPSPVRLPASLARADGDPRAQPAVFELHRRGAARSASSASGRRPRRLPHIADEGRRWRGLPADAGTGARDAKAKGSPENSGRGAHAGLPATNSPLRTGRSPSAPSGSTTARSFSGFCSSDEALFPMERRLREFEKQLSARVKRAARTIEKIPDRAGHEARRSSGKRATTRRRSKKKLAALFGSLDTRLAEVKTRSSPSSSAKWPRFRRSAPRKSIGRTSRIS